MHGNANVQENKGRVVLEKLVARYWLGGLRKLHRSHGSRDHNYKTGQAWRHGGGQAWRHGGGVFKQKESGYNWLKGIRARWKAPLAVSLPSMNPQDTTRNLDCAGMLTEGQITLLVGSQDLLTLPKTHGRWNCPQTSVLLVWRGFWVLASR